MRRVVYDDLPLSRRLDLHRRVALAIEARRPSEVELLAHHFVTARIPDRAAEYLERAAQHAMTVHAYDTAALHLERASGTLDEISAPGPRRFSVAALHEEVLDVLGRRDEQDHVLKRLERFADAATRGDVHRRRAWWLAHQDRFPEAEAEAAEALARAKASGEPGATVSALTALGMIACFGGRAAEGVRFLEEAAGFRGTDRRQEADARNALGQNLIDLQRFGEAESQLLAALALYGDLGDARGQAEVLGMLGTLRMERGEPESAEKDFIRAIDISRAIGYRHGEAVYQMNLGILQVITNRLGSALEAFDSAAETYESMGNQRGLALVQSNAAWLWHSRLGADDKAELSIATAMRVYKAIGDERGIAQCLGMLGSILAKRKDADEAWTQFERGLALARSVGDHWLTAQILRELASSELRSGLPDRAMEHVNDAERICLDIGMDDLSIGVRALRGRVLLQLGRVEEALGETTAASTKLRPGIELAHLVHFAHGLALDAAGLKWASHEAFESAYDVLLSIVSDLDEGDRAQALENVPEYKEIVSHWRSCRPEVVGVDLASVRAPTGRSLRTDEYVSVDWTVSEPSDLDIQDRVSRRHHRILRLLDQAEAGGASPTVTDLANALSISEATLRRDLAELRSRGYRVSTRGSRVTTVSAER